MLVVVLIVVLILILILVLVVVVKLANTVKLSTISDKFGISYKALSEKGLLVLKATCASVIRADNGDN